MQLYSTPGDGEVWPIYLDSTLTLPPESAWRSKPSKAHIIEAYMPVGDAIVFMGRYHTHWREKLPNSLNEAGSILFHYVQTDMDLAKWNNHRGDLEPY